MIKTKDGYSKLIGSLYNGDPTLVLLSNGGNLAYAITSTGDTLVKRNSKGLIESTTTSDAPFKITSAVVNANLNADLLDGVHKEGLFTGLSNVNTSNNPNSISITIGDTTKYLNIDYSKVSGKVSNALTLKINSGTSEGVDLYTYDGYNEKTLNIVAGSNIELTATSGSTVINAKDTTYTLSGELSSNNFVVSLTPSTGTATHATVPVMVGASSDADGKAGLVPAATKTNQGKFLRADGSWQIPTNTKNTAGSTNSTSKLFLIGATSLDTNPQTYSHAAVFATAGLLNAASFVSGAGTSDLTAGTLKLKTLNIPTTSGGSTYGPGAAGLVLKSNGTTVYWDFAGGGTSRKVLVNNNTFIDLDNTYNLNLVHGDGIVLIPTIGTSSTDNKLVITNSGVRSVTLGTGDNVNKLAIDTGGTSTYLTIPYAVLSTKVVCTEASSNNDRPIVGTNMLNEIFYTQLAKVNWSTGKITAGYILTSLVQNDGGRLTLNAASTGVDLKFNNDNSKSVILNGVAFKPFDTANGLIDLGQSDALWKTLYCTDGIFSLDIYYRSWVYQTLLSDGAGTASLGYSSGNIIGAFGNGTTATIPTYIRSTGNNLYHRKGNSNSYTDHLILDTGNYTDYTVKSGTWTATYNLNTWSRILSIKDYASVLVSIELGGTNEASLHTYLISTGYNSARIVLLGNNGFGNYYNILLRVTYSSATQYYLEVYHTYNYNSNPDKSNCRFTKLSESGTVTPITTITTGGGTVASSLTSSNSIAANFNADLLDGKHASDFAAASHSHSYIPLAGGTLSAGTSQISRAASSVSWYLGRSNAMIRISSFSGYNAIASMKTTNGDWSMGVYTDNKMYFTYILDTHFNSNNNTTTALVIFFPNGAVYASSFYEHSDINLKTNIENITTSDNIPQLKAFDWKKSGEHSYGLIAQELEEMGYSELVDSSGEHKTVKYSAALSLIVGKLQVKIKELEKEIENLKNNN